jgi:hypothetical protein
MSAYQRCGVEKGRLIFLSARLLRKSIFRGKPGRALLRGPARAPLFLTLLALTLVLGPGLCPRAAGAPGENPGVSAGTYASAAAAAVYAPSPVAGESLPGAVTRAVYRDAAGGAVRLFFPVGETVYLDVTPAAFPPGMEALAFTVTPVASGTTGISFAVYLDTGGAALPAPVQLGLPAGEPGVFLCQGERGWYRLLAQREGNHLFAAVAGTGTYGVAAAAYLPAPPAGGFTGATLRLESAAGGEVCYTTDGSDPRVSATAERYAGPVQVGADGALTVRAAAYRDGFWSEAVDFARPGGGNGVVPAVTGAEAAPAPAKEGRRWPAAGAGFRVLQCAAAEIDPAAGGALELPGVARLYLPPGALPAARPVLVRLLALEPPVELPGAGQLAGPVVWLRCRGLSGPFFNRPAELTFTGGTADAGAVKVYALGGEASAAASLPVTTGEAGGVKVMVTRPGQFAVVQ